MALNVCGSCTTRFAVGLKRCPHCASTDFQEDGVMPKITALGGASDKTLPAVDDAQALDAEAVEPLDVTEHMAGPAEPVTEPEEKDVQAPLADDSTGTPEEPEPTSEPEPGYEEWTVEQLKDELVARGLPKSGKQADLVQRLRDADAAVQGVE